MKGNMMILTPLWLFLCWMSPEGSMADNKKIQLSMEENSVDDMYSVCREEMMNIVKEKYLEKEKTDIKWNKEAIKTCTEDNVNKNKIAALTKDHLQAICIYTDKIAYKPFNDAVRTEREKYGKKNDAGSDPLFKYHSLHYLLTSAIQILNPDKKCLTVYRRTKDDYTGIKDQIIRFGMFASTSLKTDLTKFGSKTCFQIVTCFGADLTDYEKNEDQNEVLIPPYEQFTITDIYEGDRKFKKLKDCSKVFILKTTKTELSNLDCQLVPPKAE